MTKNLQRKSASPASIATVERDTGLSKDTLRIWERRYGFPSPMRDSNGERVYPAEQLEKLRVIRRLMDSGLRPGAVVAEPLSALHARVKALPARVPRAEGESGAAAEALRLLKAHQSAELRQLLAHALMQRGLQRFVIEVVAPLNEQVGNAWIAGELQIFEEHLYAEQLQQLLRHALGSLSHGAQGPRILLTTLPGEQHKLGLLMAEACLTVEGAQCISLGIQTPAWDIVQAARAHQVDIVGLSFSAAIPLKAARAGLTDLRKSLDRNIALWAGGSVWQRKHKPIPGVRMMPSLTAIPEALQAWRAQHMAG